MKAPDSNYNIIWPVGSQGRISDGGVFDNMNSDNLILPIVNLNFLIVDL